ncbi:uncharacterized protein LOC117505777 isoform X2 [Thalassophryne amazonica]|uniref:uncharacterized protein LOC117505777 isoform X2 n=1 Tax=Thalassophryne amazonica TaxID=390379 RepID=UPI00147262FE|nr:uncharacterized protein LOC117505777 isoform X2 [Thalassophryne amazonica]
MDTEDQLTAVRYHPSITAPTPGHAVPATTTTTQTQKTRKSKVHPPPGSNNAAKAQQDSPSSRSSHTPQMDQGQRRRPQKSPVPPTPKGVEKISEDTVSPQKPQPTTSRAGPRPKDVDFGVKLTRDEVEEVEKQTRGQRKNNNWFAWRKNRITASMAHQVSSCRFVNHKSDTPAPSLLDMITGQRRGFRTEAIKWGIKNEGNAVNKYKELKSAMLGRPISVQNCGLFIDPERPWLVGSPDGIVTDTQTGQRLLCLEVKCPHKHKDRTVEDACREDPHFCLSLQDNEGQEPRAAPVYCLKTSHPYYTQIQCQLAVTGLRQADLVVFTLKETAIVPVTFDPVLWEQTVSKLEKFYEKAILPHVKRERQEDAAAAVRTPEQ